MSNANFNNSHVGLETTSPSSGARGFRPEVDLEEAGVFTFPHVVLEDGRPLIFSGRLGDARKAVKQELEAARKRKKDADSDHNGLGLNGGDNMPLLAEGTEQHPDIDGEPQQDLTGVEQFDVDQQAAA